MNNIKLYQGDCLEIMNTIPDKSVDMILCDLPYNLTHNSWDIMIPFDILWEQYNRVITDNGVIALFGQGMFYVKLVNSNPDMFRYDLVWDKVLSGGFLNANRMPLRSHEQIAIFYKSVPTYNPQLWKGKPLHGKGVSYRDREFKNQNYGKFELTDDERQGSTDKYPTSIVSFQKPHPSQSIHPTQKPTELLSYLIMTYTNENDVVLDNCMGSGSTGVACVQTKRDFIGIELDEHYFTLAKERIEREKLAPRKMSLF